MGTVLSFVFGTVFIKLYLSFIFHDPKTKQKSIYFIYKKFKQPHRVCPNYVMQICISNEKITKISNTNKNSQMLCFGERESIHAANGAKQGVIMRQ